MYVLFMHSYRLGELPQKKGEKSIVIYEYFNRRVKSDTTTKQRGTPTKKRRESEIMKTFRTVIFFSANLNASK